MTKRYRTLSLLLAIVVLFVVLFSSAYLCSRTTHHCIGSGCSVCMELKACAAVLKTMSAVCFILVGLFLSAFFIWKMSCAAHSEASEDTPVSLKVKLTN